MKIAILPNYEAGFLERTVADAQLLLARSLNRSAGLGGGQG